MGSILRNVLIFSCYVPDIFYVIGVIRDNETDINLHRDETWAIDELDDLVEHVDEEVPLQEREELEREGVQISWDSLYNKLDSLHQLMKRSNEAKNNNSQYNFYLNSQNLNKRNGVEAEEEEEYDLGLKEYSQIRKIYPNFEKVERLTDDSDFKKRSVSNQNDDDIYAYDYEAFKREYYINVEDKMKLNSTFNYTDNGKPEENISDALNKIIDINEPKNCSQAEENQEYSEDSNSEPDVDLENQYYNSKALKEDDPKSALTSFQKVLDLEGGEKGEWGFKALKQMIKINFKLNNYKEMMSRYKQLLTYIKSAVTRNHSEKSINSILDYISTSKNMELLQDFYETTLEALKDAKNDRLWFKTNTKLGKLYFDRNDFVKLSKILKQLHQSCQTDDGEDDLKKGTQLLEIYALEIQMYTAQKNNKKLKTLYEQSLHIKSAIPHPLIMGVIRECGGKMHLREGEFEKAHTDFFEAFKNYDESGSPRRTTCLKYLVLANMLMKSGINPFDSQEAKPYKNDPEILAMTNLVSSYQNNDINEFEKILKQNRKNIMDDLFIREHIEDLLRNIRTQVLIKLITPYTRIHIPFISKELNIDASEVESLLVSCILDSTIRGRIDQVNQVLELDQQSLCAARYNALDKWTNQLASLHMAVVNKMA